MVVETASVLSTLHIIVTSLSTAGSILMAYFCVKSRVYETAPGKLILSIAFSDLFFACANIMSLLKYQNIPIVCQVEAFIRAWSYMLCLLFPACIAALCYLTSSLYRRFDQDYFVKITIPIIIIFCSCFSIVPMFMDSMKYDEHDFICRIAYPPICYWIAILIALLLTFILYFLSIRKARRITSLFVQELDLRIYRLFWYPAVIFVGFLIPQALKLAFPSSFLIRRVMVLVTDSVGLQNAIIYGCQRKLYGSSDDERTEEYKQSILESDTDMGSSLSKIKSIKSRNSVKISLIEASHY